MSLAEFLESVPPSQMRQIEKIVTVSSSQYAGVRYSLTTPEIRLHCGHANCGGLRIFRCSDGGPSVNHAKDGFSFDYVTYVCSNCQETQKIFAIASRVDDAMSRTGSCYKFGELPAYGPPTPSRLLDLIGPDRDLFLSGRRCESQGLGIGAFSYYRRVVENQKDRILDRIIKTAETLNTPESVLENLRQAKEETQFVKAMNLARDAMPDGLKIKGHNPLTLLHAALSQGLRAEDDETCLELSHAIRVVLADLSDRMGQLLKDTRELHEAISFLMKIRAEKSS